MDAIFLLICFYIYAGLLFTHAQALTGIFSRFHWLVLVFFWPVFFTIYLVKSIRESDFGWFVRYGIFKLTH